MYLSDMNGSKDDLSFWGNLLEVTSWWLENTQCLGQSWCFPPFAALFCVVFLYDKHEAHLFERPVWNHTGHSKRIKPHITYIRYLFFPHIPLYTLRMSRTLRDSFAEAASQWKSEAFEAHLGLHLGLHLGDPQGFGSERKPNLTEPKLSQICCRNNSSP